MTTANHILAQEGILTAFSIAKRVTAKDIKKLREKIKAAGISNAQANSLIKKSIVEDTKKAVAAKKIPGLVLPVDPSSTQEGKTIIELTYFASLISKKISEKGMDKYHACYIINAIVNMLALTENDFEEFHRKFAEYRERNGEPPDTADE